LPLRGPPRPQDQDLRLLDNADEIAHQITPLAQAASRAAMRSQSCRHCAMQFAWRSMPTCPPAAAWLAGRRRVSHSRSYQAGGDSLHQRDAPAVSRLSAALRVLQLYGAQLPRGLLRGGVTIAHLRKDRRKPDDPSAIAV